MFAPGKMVSVDSAGEELSTGTLVAVLSALSGAIQPSLSSQDPSLLRSTLLCLGPVCVAVNEILCANPFRGHLSFYQHPISPWWTQSPLFLQANVTWEPLFGSVTPGGGVQCGMKTPRVSWGTFAAEISLQIPSRFSATKLGPALFASSPFPSVSMWLLL